MSYVFAAQVVISLLLSQVALQDVPVSSNQEKAPTKEKITTSPTTTGIEQLVEKSGRADARIEGLEKEITSVKTNQSKLEDTTDNRMDDFSKELSHYRTVGYVVTAVVSVLGLVSALGLWKYITSFLTSYADKLLVARVDKAEQAWQENLEQRINAFEQSVSVKLERISSTAELSGQLQSLRHAKQYGEAIELVGWDFSEESLEKYPRLMQKTILECAGRVGSDHRGFSRGEIRRRAWVLVQQFANPRVPEDVKFIIGESIQHREYEAGLSLYQSALSSGVKLEDESHRLACVLLRHIGDNQQALDLAMKYKDGCSLNHKNMLAALLADSGRWNEAQAMIETDVKGWMRVSFNRRPKGWHQTATTYISICIDLDTPLEGVDAAKMLLQEEPDNVALYVCGRLGKALPHVPNPADAKSVSSKEFIFKKIEENLLTEHGVQGDLAQAILIEYKSGAEEAIKYLVTRIADATSRLNDEQVTSKKLGIENEIYRLTVHKCWLLLESQKYEECCSCLIPVMASDRFGDASFIHAKCLVMLKKKDRISDAKAYLDVAFRKRAKWRETALRDKDFKGVQAIAAMMSNTIGKLA